MKTFEFSGGDDRIVIAANSTEGARKALEAEYGPEEFKDLSVKELSQHETERYEVQDEDRPAIYYALSDLMLTAKVGEIVCQTT